VVFNSSGRLSITDKFRQRLHQLSGGTETLALLCWLNTGLDQLRDTKDGVSVGRRVMQQALGPAVVLGVR